MPRQREKRFDSDESIGAETAIHLSPGMSAGHDLTTSLRCTLRMIMQRYFFTTLLPAFPNFRRANTALPVWLLKEWKNDCTNRPRWGYRKRGGRDEGKREDWTQTGCIRECEIETVDIPLQAGGRCIYIEGYLLSLCKPGAHAYVKNVGAGMVRKSCDRGECVDGGWQGHLRGTPK